jgi:formylglycine-generating enzyme required for sulfatase activity
MHGNVSEWCLDNWHDNYENAPIDGSAWIDSEENDSMHVLRGGSWFYGSDICRSAFRYWDITVNYVDLAGFRVVYAPART